MSNQKSVSRACFSVYIYYETKKQLPPTLFCFKEKMKSKIKFRESYVKARDCRFDIFCNN